MARRRVFSRSGDRETGRGETYRERINVKKFERKASYILLICILFLLNSNLFKQVLIMILVCFIWKCTWKSAKYYATMQTLLTEITRLLTNDDEAGYVNNFICLTICLVNYPFHLLQIFILFFRHTHLPNATENLPNQIRNNQILYYASAKAIPTEALCFWFVRLGFCTSVCLINVEKI